MLRRQYCRDSYSRYHIDTHLNTHTRAQQPWQHGGGIWQNTSSETPACRQKNTPPEKTKRKQKTKRPISLPHPQFQMARQVTGSPRWNTLECLLHGGLAASSSSTQWISLKTTSEGLFKRAGQACIWNSKWNVFFSVLAASPLSLSLKNMNREILSLLFLLYNKRDLQYGRPPFATPLLSLWLLFFFSIQRRGVERGSIRCHAAAIVVVSLVSTHSRKLGEGCRGHSKQTSLHLEVLKQWLYNISCHIITVTLQRQ